MRVTKSCLGLKKRLIKPWKGVVIALQKVLMTSQKEWTYNSHWKGNTQKHAKDMYSVWRSKQKQLVRGYHISAACWKPEKYLYGLCWNKPWIGNHCGTRSQSTSEDTSYNHGRHYLRPKSEGVWWQNFKGKWGQVPTLELQIETHTFGIQVHIECILR